MKVRNIFLLSLALLPGLPAGAQQLKEQINVDGRYHADIIRQDRLHTLPAPISFSLAAKPMPWSEKSVAANFAPSLLAMTATGWNASRTPDSRPGYFDLAAGSWLNAVASFGYRFIQSEDTQFGIAFQHNSTSLFKYRPDPESNNPFSKRKAYDENIAFFGSHTFGDTGRLDASLSYHLGYFNYFAWIPGATFDPDAPAQASPTPTQTLNDINALISWASPQRSGSLSYKASLSARHFGYRALYTPDAAPARGLKETDITLGGTVAMPWDNGSSVGADVAIDALLYGSKNAANLPDNYANIALAPFYRFSRGLLNVRVGANIDLTANAGLPTQRYSFFHIAPNVRLDWQSRQVGLYLHVLGGSTLQTLASLAQYDYYQAPYLANTRPVYTPIDATLGFNFGPFAGFTAGLHAAFKTSKKMPLRGWYMHATALDTDPVEYNLAFNDPDGADIHGISLGASLAYELGSQFAAHASFSYQPQNGTTGYFNGFDRPKITANAAIRVSPIKPLTLSLDFDFRGSRAIYRLTPDPDAIPGIIVGGNINPSRLEAFALPDFVQLGFGAEYALTSAFSVRAQACNLLNRRNVLLPSTPTERINFLLGFGVVF